MTKNENLFIPAVRDSDNDPFLDSLENITAEDIAPDGVKEKVSGSDIARRVIKALTSLVLAAVFIWSVYEIVTSIYNYKRGDDIYADIAGDFHSADGESAETEIDLSELHGRRSPKNPTTPDFASALLLGDDIKLENEKIEAEQYNRELEEVKAKLNYLSEKYPDLYGWITVPDTNIDYPIVQYGDNDYYLSHAANGDYLPAGSIFCDYRCDTNILRNHNTVLYGHNMMNGLMFNNVTYYLEEDFYNSHPYITISTPDGIFTYFVFAIYQTDMYYSYINTDFLTHEDFVEWANEMEKNSLFHRDGIEFVETDRVLTMSTCTNGYYTNRYCLQALLVDIVQ